MMVHYKQNHNKCVVISYIAHINFLRAVNFFAKLQSNSCLWNDVVHLSVYPSV